MSIFETSELQRSYFIRELKVSTATFIFFRLRRFVARYPVYTVANGADKPRVDALATAENVIFAQAVTEL
jgi:hypothetical protein